MHCKKAFPQGKVAWAKPMTDEGDHGGAPVIDGPLGTAAPTKSIVTLRRGGCPHPPVRGPPHLTIPTLIRPLRDHLPPGRGKAKFAPAQCLPLGEGGTALAVTDEGSAIDI